MTPAQEALRAMLADHDAQEHQRSFTWMVERVHVKERATIVEALRRVTVAETAARQQGVLGKAFSWLSP